MHKSIIRQTMIITNENVANIFLKVNLYTKVMLYKLINIKLALYLLHLLPIYIILHRTYIFCFTAI